MAKRMLGFKVKLGHGLIESREIEERIVAKTAGATGRFKDEAIYSALRGVECLAVAGSYERAKVARCAPGHGHTGKALQQDDVVPDVSVVIRVGRVDQAGVCGNTGRA